MFKIKWLKLKDISQRMVNKHVDLFLSTVDFGNNVAICELDGDNVNIYFNAAMCKSVQDIIAALAHELAHVTVGYTEHTEEFRRKWRLYIRRIGRMYNDK